MKKADQSKNTYFSILMANFNNARFIETALNSVLSQTYPNWELIIVDDCSTDDSLDIINQFLGDERTKFIQHKTNKGYGGSLKTAAANASNEIIGILDADDKLHVNALKIMAEAYQRFPECGLIYSNMWNCNSNLENCKVSKDLGPIKPEKTSIFNPTISHFKTFRKTAYLKTSGFDPNQKKGVDKDIIFKLEEVCKLKFIDEPLYYYRQHPMGISQGESVFLSRIYYYIAKCKAYQRRLHTNLPNYNLKDLYREYYKITFHSLITFVRKIMKFARIKFIIEKLSKKYTIFNSIMQKTGFLNKVFNKL